MNLQSFMDRIADIPSSRAEHELKRKSKDYFWFSPLLSEELGSCQADVIVSPRGTEDVVRIAAAAVATRVPITARGGGTGNYGQAVPLQGGAVIDMTALDRLTAVADGIATVGAGKTLFSLETELGLIGHELRLFPSTWRTATIGGFVSGGSSGVGSVTWGGLRESGNLLEATLVTVEDQPRIISLRGDDCGLVNRTFGTTGLVVALQVPVEPAVDWHDVMVAFQTFDQAINFGVMLCQHDEIRKRLCSVSDDRIAAFFKPYAGAIPPGCSIAALMVDASDLVATRDLAATFGGRVTLERKTPHEEQIADVVPIYELAFNHATLQVLKRSRGYTYLQSIYPTPEVLHALRRELGEEAMWHVEFIRFNGAHVMSGLPVIRFSDADRLYEVIAKHEQYGAKVANPHVWTVEDGSSYKRLPGDQLSFKHAVDPMGLLNPGKMRTFTSRVGA